MATHAPTAPQALVTAAEYLATTYRPDRDFLDGVLQERNMGEQPHARIQGLLSLIFGNHRLDWNVRALPEQRVQIALNRFRIPDLCILRHPAPKDPIVRVAPLLCIEILSKDDSLTELQNRMNDYAALGTEHLWAIDPWGRRAWYASTRGFEQPADATLRIPNTPILISLADLWAELDED